MALLIHVRSHPYELVGELCGRLASPPDDPFASELVAAPTRGIERWLAQRIASEMGERTAGDGVCANVEFPSPGRLVRRVMLAVPELAESVEAWERGALVRSVVSTLDDNLDRAGLEVIARYIRAPEADTPLGNSQRLQAARKIAGLFIQYARRRPAMIRAWRQGEDIGPGGGALPEADAWQPGLWRLVRDRIGVPGLAELLPAALDPIRDGSIDTGLPDRLFVYGLTAFDPFHMEVLEAVSSRREVHLCLLHPSPALWGETARLLEQAPPGTERPMRDEDPTGGLARHPLLRTWARESRELQFLLAGRTPGAGPTLPPPPPTPIPAPPSAPGPSLLGRLQHAVRANLPPPPRREEDGQEEGVGPDDRSVQIHVSHGARRQVEVLRDAVLHALADDPTLEPRDVVVMTPDIASFAPLLEAAFMRDADAAPDPADAPDRKAETEAATEAEGSGLPDLRIRIADQAPAAVNPLVRFAASVFDLAGSRLEAATIRELTGLPVVRQRFGLDDDLADDIAAMIEDANVRWGLDSAHRADWGAGAGDSHTWRRGLDRALAGVFYADSNVRVVGGVAPLGGVEGQEARPAGLLAQIIDRIEAVRSLLGHSRPFSQWGPAVAAAVRLLAAPAWAEQWQWGHLERLLERSFPPPEDGTQDSPAPRPAPHPDPEISPAEARLAVEDWTQDAPGPLHFRTGYITVCTLAPMRSVPYRVVCLLGMDDERFPRGGGGDGDDLLLDHELIGDPDRAAEDRQLLLDAVMAAGDRLIITYSGRDELTNAEYPPAAPVAELRDVLYEMAGAEGLKKIVTHHPLQPFSEKNFDPRPGRLGVEGPWSFDPMQYNGALAVQRRARSGQARQLRYPFFAAGYDPPSVIRLHDLLRFLEHPARHFLWARLGFRIPETGEISDDIVPADLDPLAQWGLADRLLTGLLEGRSLEELEARERAADALPPGRLARKGLEAAGQRALGLWTAAREIGYDPRRRERFSGGVTVNGCAVEGGLAADRTQARIDLVTPSRLKGKHRLRAFVQVVFLTALEPSAPWHGRLIGRHLRGDKLWTVAVGKLGQGAGRRKQEADRLLAGLVDLYLEGLERPIPLPCETGFAWQRNLGGDKGPFPPAAREWEPSSYNYGRPPAEGEDPAYEMLFSGLAGMDALAAPETGFREYAKRLWGPILPLLSEKAVRPEIGENKEKEKAKGNKEAEG